MSHKLPKTKVVAFKVEEQLADILNKLPNKSAFIREAIAAHAAQLNMTCPLCNGAGVVGRAVRDHYAPLIAKMAHRHCDGCGDNVGLPAHPGELSMDVRSRLEQFFSGGPLYCDGCYDKAPTCGDCGWHIGSERAAEHQKSHTIAE